MKITDYEVIDHGIENSSYFQGCGTAFTNFEFVVTGCGSNPAEAFDDAFEQMAQTHDVDTEELSKRILKDHHKRTYPKRPAVKASEEDCYYYVSIRYNVEAPVTAAEPTDFAGMIHKWRSANAGGICLFRIGDFFELFYDDATVGAQVLGLALTSRDKEPNAIPMAGFPFHQLDAYSKKLVAAGYRVAVIEPK
jgi:hypothetical protein